MGVLSAGDEVVEVANAPKVVSVGLIFGSFEEALPIAVVVKMACFGGGRFEDAAVEAVVSVGAPPRTFGNKRAAGDETKIGEVTFS